MARSAVPRTELRFAPDAGRRDDEAVKDLPEPVESYLRRARCPDPPSVADVDHLKRVIDRVRRGPSRAVITGTKTLIVPGRAADGHG